MRIQILILGFKGLNPNPVPNIKTVVHSTTNVKKRLSLECGRYLTGVPKSIVVCQMHKLVNQIWLVKITSNRTQLLVR